MKRWIAMLLVFLLALPAMAQADEEMKLVAEVTGMRVTQQYNGERSDEYDWLVVNLNLTNWHTDTQSISENLSGLLTFREVYIFDGVPEFDGDTIAPLVEKSGSLVFMLPKMVAESMNPDEIALSISVEGDTQALELEAKPSSTQRSGTFESAGYDTPEDAVLAYLDGLNRGDATAMLSTFAHESYVAHANPEYSILRMSAFMMSSVNAMPLNDDFSRSLTINGRYAYLANQLRYLYVEASANTDGKAVPISDAESYRELMDQFENSPMSRWIGNVTFVRWLEPAALCENYAESRNILNIARQMACSGAEDVAVLAAHVRLNGEDAIQTMSCVKYDGRWFNLDLSNNLSVLLGIDSFSAGLLYAVPDSEEAENDAVSSEYIQDILAEYESASVDSEPAPWLSNLDDSDLGGTSWQLTGTNEATITVLDTKEGIRDRSDPAIYAQLHFMSNGGAYIDLRVGGESAGIYDYDVSMISMIWSEQSGMPLINDISCLGLDISTEDVRLTRNGDEMTLCLSDEGELTFEKIDD